MARAVRARARVCVCTCECVCARASVRVCLCVREWMLQVRAQGVTVGRDERVDARGKVGKVRQHAAADAHAARRSTRVPIGLLSPALPRQRRRHGLSCRQGRLLRSARARAGQAGQRLRVR